MINYWRWHPEVAIRYLPIVKKITQTFGRKKIRILEVGSGWLGIAPYLNQPITGLEEKKPDKLFKGLSFCQGSILKIPFNDNSFAVVICVDVLEHLKKQDRQKAITEVLRVAAKYLYLAVPCSLASLQQDKKLAKNFSYSFLQEHLKNLLPEKADIMATLEKSARDLGKKITIDVQGNENLNWRWFLMKGFASHNWLVNIFFRKIMLLFLPLLFIVNRPPFYRQIFSVRIDL